MIGSAALSAALDAYCQEMIEPSPAGWPTRKLLLQMDRYYAAYMLIRMFYGRRAPHDPPPTLARLKAISGLSARHTGNFVSVLKSAKLVSSEPLNNDRRQAVLRPSHELIREVGRSCVTFLVAHDRLANTALAPPIAASADRLGMMISLSAEQIAVTGTVIAPFPTIAAMAGFDSGYPVLMAVLANHYRRIQGTDGVDLTYTALAQRFQVSRSHVGNILGYLSAAEAIDAKRQARPALVKEFETWSLAQMEHYAVLASLLAVAPHLPARMPAP